MSLDYELGAFNVLTRSFNGNRFGKLHEFHGVLLLDGHNQPIIQAVTFCIDIRYYVFYFLLFRQKQIIFLLLVQLIAI